MFLPKEHILEIKKILRQFDTYCDALIEDYVNKLEEGTNQGMYDFIASMNRNDSLHKEEEIIFSEDIEQARQSGPLTKTQLANWILTQGHFSLKYKRTSSMVFEIAQNEILRLDYPSGIHPVSLEKEKIISYVKNTKLSFDLDPLFKSDQKAEEFINAVENQCGDFRFVKNWADLFILNKSNTVIKFDNDFDFAMAIVKDHQTVINYLHLCGEQHLKKAV